MSHAIGLGSTRSVRAREAMPVETIGVPG